MLKRKAVILGSVALWAFFSCGKTIVVASTDTALTRNATILMTKTDKSSDPLKAPKGSKAMDKAKELLIFDFTKRDDRNQWRPINDTVMGGVSASQLQTTEEGRGWKAIQIFYEK
jgi:hypothetical protein